MLSRDSSLCSEWQMDIQYNAISLATNSYLLTTLPMQLHPAAFEFLKAINDYNTRKFFGTVRPLYDEILENIKQICAESIKRISEFDPDVADLQPKDCLFRIYRDARRIKDWWPLYKNNRWMAIWPGWKKSDLPGYYFHMQPWGKSFFGWWVYRPEPAHLRNLRHYLAKHWDQYKKIMAKAAFKKTFWSIQGESLSRPPMGFKNYTHYLEFIQRKQHMVFKKFSDKEILNADIVDLIVEHAKISYEWMNFLRTGMMTKWE